MDIETRRAAALSMAEYLLAEENYRVANKKANICAAVWFVTVAIFGYCSYNDLIPGNIWETNNYLLIAVFIANGVSLVMGLRYWFIMEQNKNIMAHHQPPPK